MMETTAGLPLYLVENIEYRLSEHFELRVPRLVVNRGESLGVAGPSGGGKSTLLSLLAFLDKPQRGRIMFNGHDAWYDKSDNSNKGVTHLSQEPYLLKRSVFDNVAYPLKIRGRYGSIKKKVYEALDMVGLKPNVFASRRWYELSGGEAQRVALAARLVLKPQVLILDEPTSGIDQTNALLIKEAITSFRKAYGTSLIMASHDTLWLAGATDRVIKLFDGRIVTTESANLIPGPWIKQEKELFAKKLADERLIYAVTPPHSEATGILDPSDIIIALEPPMEVSAQNILPGRISRMTAQGKERAIIVEVIVADIPLSCRVTRQGARQLGLLPGKEVWLVFKASSIRWE